LPFLLNPVMNGEMSESKAGSPEKQVNDSDIKWLWKRFQELTTKELYEVMKLRQKVFVVEQNCAYLDLDDRDNEADHLLVSGKEELLGYLRVTPAGTRFTEYSIGRVVTHPKVRGSGMGKAMTKRAIQYIQDVHGDQPIRISAQSYLENFYTSFGFKRLGKEYDEDGIPHIEMLYEPTTSG